MAEGLDAIVNFFNALAQTPFLAYIEFLSGNVTQADKCKEAVYIGIQPLVDQ